MADLADVSDTFAALIAGMLYPDGTSQPSATGTPYAIYPGWPDPKCLTREIKQGKAHVTVYPLDVERNTTRYLEHDAELIRGEKTIIATVAGETITLAGTVAGPQNVVVFANGQTVALAVQNDQTLAQVAAGLANLLVTHEIAEATSEGAVITVPGAVNLAVDVGVHGKKARVLRRQDRQFMVSIWAPSHAVRTATAKIIDPGLTRLFWIDLPDLTHGRNIHVRSADSDEAQEVSIYRRDLVWSVDFPTIEVFDGTEVLVGRISQAGSQYPIGQGGGA